MFYKIGFWILLVIVIAFVGLFLKTNPMKSTGAASWVEFYSDTPAETISFLENNFGIKVVNTTKTPMDVDYSIVKAKGQLWPFAGVMQTMTMPDGKQIPAGTVVYLTVKDYNAAHEKAMASGATANATHLRTEDMLFGFYTIPGNVNIGIVQYEHVKNDK